MKISTTPPKEVVIILPFVGKFVLMQLRDVKSNIPFPGQWGFFGGSIEEGESPRETAIRELNEEVGFRSKEIFDIETVFLPELGNIMNHSFYCALTVPVEQLTLTEGQDLGLFTLEEVLTTKLYSRKLKKYFPVIPSQHVTSTIKKMWQCLDKLRA